MASATPCQRNLQSPSSFFQNSNPSPSSSEYTTSDSVLEDHVYVCGGCATRASKRNHRQRFWKLLVGLMSRFVIDMVLWTSFISAVFYTERLQDLGQSGRYTFNAVNVGLPLMLGLNYNAAFQTMAGIMRWKVLASGRFTFKEADLILNLDSFMTVFKLGLHWVRAIFIAEEGKQRCIYSGRALACLGWVLLGLGTQTGVGLLGLTIDVNPVNCTDNGEASKVKLTAAWPRLIIAAGVLLTIHIILINIALYFGCSVACGAGSHLSTAILLKPVIDVVDAEKRLHSRNEYYKEATYRISYGPTSGVWKCMLNQSEEVAESPV